MNTLQKHQISNNKQQKLGLPLKSEGTDWPLVSIVTGLLENTCAIHTTMRKPESTRLMQHGINYQQCM